MRVLGEEPWAWMLFEDETSKYLSVVCGSVGIYEICFTLSELEAAELPGHMAREIQDLPNGAQIRLRVTE